jgi:hypothetical protein
MNFIDQTHEDQKQDREDAARFRWLVDSSTSLHLSGRFGLSQPLKRPAPDPDKLRLVREEIDRWIAQDREPAP